MNKKRISLNIISNIVALAITLAITFFLTPYIIRVLGKEAYGFFPMANTIVSYTSVVTLAVNAMAGRFIALAYHKGEIQKAKAYFNTVFIADIFLAAILFVLSVVVVIFLDKIINIPQELITDVKILFLLLFFASMVILALSAFKTCTFISNRIDIDAYISIFKAVIRAAVLIVLFAFFVPNIAFVGLASCIIFLMEAFAYVRLKRKLIGELKIDFSLFSKDRLKELVNSGKWKSLGTINSILFLGLDLVFANIFLGAAKAGTLAIAKNIPAYSFSLLNIVALSFNPTFISDYAKNKDSLFDNLRRSFIVLTLMGSVMFGGVLITGDLFYRLWVPSESSTELQILTALNMLPYFITYGTRTLGYVVTIVNKIKYGALVNTVVAALSCLMVIVLLKTTSLGLYAIAGVSSVLIIIANLTLLIPYSAKCIDVKWHRFFLYILRSILCLGTTVAVGLAVRTLVPMNSWLSFVLGVFIISIISFGINFFIVTNKNNRKNLLKQTLAMIKRS